MKRSFKKRLLTIFLVLIMLSGMIPMSTGAANSTVEILSANTVAQNQALIQNAINGASSGGIVTVIGTVSGMTSGITLNIRDGVTVDWRAFYIGSPGVYLIRLTGAGNFIVDADGDNNAWIENTGSGTALYSQGEADINVKGGVVAANTGNALWAEGLNTVITVNGFGSVFNSAANNIRPALNMTNASNTRDNVIVNERGSVASISRDGSGYAIQTYGNVIVGGNARVHVTNGRAINLVGADSSATINGGEVFATGTGTAISTATTNPGTVPRAGVVVTGGIVSAESGMAIQVTGISSQVTVTGGTVSNTSASAVGNAAIHGIGTNTNITVTGGSVSSENGRAINVATAASSSIINVSGGSVSSAGNGNAIHAMGAVSAINISGTGNVSAQYGYAIYLTSGGNVSVTGNSQVSAMSEFAIYAMSGSVTVDGGFVFAYGTGAGSIGNVVRNPAFTGPSGGPSGEGIVVAWVPPRGLVQLDGSRSDLFIRPTYPVSNVHWAGGGIDYVNGSTSGFFPIPNMVVYANHGLIYDIAMGLFYRNVDGSGRPADMLPTIGTSYLNVEYTSQGDNYDSEEPVTGRTRTLVLDGFNWYSKDNDGSTGSGSYMQIALVFVSSNHAIANNLVIELAPDSTNTFISGFTRIHGELPITAGIWASQIIDATTITGSGALNSAGGDLGDTGSISIGIAIQGTDLNIKGGTINATGGNADISIGIACTDTFRSSNLNIDGGDTTAVGGNVLSSAGVIMQDGEFRMTSGRFTAIGNFRALINPMTSIPAAYTYWTRTDTSQPPANDFGTRVPAGIPYVFSESHMFVRIDTNVVRWATIGDGTVSGARDIAFPDMDDMGRHTAVITLIYDWLSDKQKGLGSAPQKASTWFSYLPNGVVVMAQAIPGEQVAPDTILLTFIGTPFETSDAVFDITIPGFWLRSGEDLTVQLNPLARFNIVPTNMLSVSSNVGGSVSGTPSGLYPAGHVVIVSAEADDGWHFTGWTITGAELEDDLLVKRAVFNMPGNAVTLTANFAQNPSDTYTLNVYGNEGGTVSGTMSGAYAAGYAVAITAIANDGWHFTGWTVDGVVPIEGLLAKPARFAMPTNAVTITANFAQNPAGTYTLNVLGCICGTVSGSMSGAYPAGYNVSVTAVGHDGWRFSHWTIDGAVITGGNTANPAEFIMPANAVTIKAEFVPVGVLAAGAPPTGVDSNLILPIALLTLGLLIISGAEVYRRRKKKTARK